MASRRGVWLVALACVALLINTPLLYSAWISHRIAEDGIYTTAEVLDAEGVPDDDPEVWIVTYRFTEEIDPDQNEYQIQVDEETYNYARTSDLVEVRYLDGKPGAHVVKGHASNNLLTIMVVLGDLALLGFLWLYLKVGRRDRTLKLLATSDVERSRSTAYGLSQVSGDEWVVVGEISKIVGDVITLVTEGGREVQVTLAEHENLVGYQQPCQVRGRELPR